MTETMPPDPFLAGQTDNAIDSYRQIRDGWTASPRMQGALSAAQLIARAVGQEFPAHPDAPRLIIALVAALSSVRQIVLLRDGVLLETAALLELARVAAVELDDKAAGRG